jgi:hypothetical protein
MESTSLASAADAELLLRLYELRRETTMRAARQWITAEFKPESAQDVIAILNAFGSQKNQYLRQVLSYWEMAASFVLRGALDSELFAECNNENILLLAKFHPFLEQIRAVSPDFLLRTEQVALKNAGSRALLERHLKASESRRQALLEPVL